MTEGTLNMSNTIMLKKLPKDIIWAVRVVTPNSYDLFNTIAAFESLRDATYYMQLTGVTSILEPIERTSVLLKDVTICQNTMKGYYV